MTLLLAVLLLLGAGVSPSAAAIYTVDTANCAGCHSQESWELIHQIASHIAAPNSGQVTLYNDNSHDDAGWHGSKPYFAVTVFCGTCHNSNIQALHGYNCSICHPTPYDTLGGSWAGGCQQGGCHEVRHRDVLKAHLPFENVADPNNDCLRCHDPATWAVTETKCLNCHAAFSPTDLTGPVTSTDALAEYIGPAIITFSIMDNGKVGVGTTSYRLEGGEVTHGTDVFVTAPGDHTLVYWSKDQLGNLEATTNMESFTIIEDITPPTTTSDAQASYYQGAVINLSATDDGTLGVMNTFYTINGGTAQTGTKVVIPATSGVIPYTLTYWSVDWSGNEEAPHTDNFTVTSGGGTIRLVWGDSDTDPSQAPVGNDSAQWTIRSGSFTGPIVASGSGTAPSWDGVDDVVVPVSLTPYFVRIDWYWEAEDWYDQTDFANINITTPGQLIRLSY